jgi:hypothetical protein
MTFLQDSQQFSPQYIYTRQYINVGRAVAQLVEALRYKSEGRGFDSRWCHWIFFIDIILLAAP